MRGRLQVTAIAGFGFHDVGNQYVAPSCDQVLFTKVQICVSIRLVHGLLSCKCVLCGLDGLSDAAGPPFAVHQLQDHRCQDELHGDIRLSARNDDGIGSRHETVVNH